jgi:alanine racemase
MTHFHSAESDLAVTREQWRRFIEALRGMRSAGLEPGRVHVANSAAALRYEGFAADMVRPGIHLYGGGDWEPASRPVVSVRARVLDVRDVEEGATVSYGATWTAPSRTRLATLGIGYGDGLRRALSNRGRALLGGEVAPIRGAVCMDMTVVEVPEGADARPGDVATLLGTDGQRSISLAEMARLCGTIDYEILTGWSRRLPRVETGGPTDPGQEPDAAGEG